MVVHEGYWDWGQKSQFWSSIPRCVDHRTHTHTQTDQHTRMPFIKNTHQHTQTLKIVWLIIIYQKCARHIQLFLRRTSSWLLAPPILVNFCQYLPGTRNDNYLQDSSRPSTTWWATQCSLTLPPWPGWPLTTASWSAMWPGTQSPSPWGKHNKQVVTR